jgi:ankyrin repeat protein
MIINGKEFEMLASNWIFNYYLAIKSQNIDAFNFLVENSADLNKKTKNGQSLLHIG